MADEIEEVKSLSLSRLHETLKLRGVDMTLSTLSQFINSGDVSEQLRVGGKQNRREFLPETVDILAEFLPKFRSLKGVGWEQAPAYLRSALKGQSTELVASHVEVSKVHETSPMAIADAQGRAQGLAMTDEVFNAEQAAAFLGVSVSSLHEHVKASFRIGRAKRWRKSDLLDL